MKSSKKIKLGQIERGDELSEIDKKALDTEVVHKSGNLDEEIDGNKTFKEAPKSQKKAIEDQELVRLKELNEAVSGIADDSTIVRTTNTNQTIDGVKTFVKPPKSNVDASSNSELVRYGQYTTDLDNKANDSDVVKLTDDQSIEGVKTFESAPKSNTPASVDADLIRKKEFDAGMSDKVDTEIGKGLSSNDYTDEEKTKLEGIEEGAQKNTVFSVNTKVGDVVLDADDIDESLDRKWAGETGADITGDHKSADSGKLGGELPSYYAQDSLVVKIADKGVAGGVAELDDDGKVPVSQLPSFVSDVLEFDSENDFPTTGESGIIYVAKDTNKTYRWSGSGYVVIGDGELSLGETSDTAYRGDRGKIAYDHSKLTSGNPHNVTKADVGLDNVTNDEQLKKADNLADLPSKSTARTNLGLGSAAINDEADFAKPADIKDGVLTIKVNGVTEKTFSANQETAETVDLPDTTYDLATQSEDGLMSSTDKEKLDTLEQGGQVNVQADYAELDAELDSFIKNKEAYIHVADEFDYYEGDSQVFNLSNELYKLISVEVNGQGLVRSQWNEWHNAIEILDTLDGEVGDEDSIRITYLAPTDYSRIHGFRFNETLSAPEVERIGNLDMATELPIQKGMKGCLLLDNGKVNYFLNKDDWAFKEDGSTPSDLTGADGQVMVKVPRHWMKDTTQGNIRTVLFSDKPFEGATEIEGYVGAYKASEDRTNNVLASVMNSTAQFRGGNNQSAWDNDSEYKSQRGKPVTAKSRTALQQLANARGENWHQVDMVLHTSVAWLITYEFGTRNHQQVISEGATGLSSSLWNDYNTHYPLFKCGLTNSLGNGTGEVTLDISAENLGADTVSVFRYRGIENWWGDIYEWMSGVNIIENKYYMTTGKLESDTNADGYKYIGDRPTANGYIQRMHPGTLLPATNNGSSSTYYADYLYTNDTASIRGLLRSALATNGAHAGSFFVASHNAPSTTRANVGSRLCFSKR